GWCAVTRACATTRRASTKRSAWPGSAWRWTWPALTSARRRPPFLLAYCCCTARATDFSRWNRCNRSQMPRRRDSWSRSTGSTISPRPCAWTGWRHRWRTGSVPSRRAAPAPRSPCLNRLRRKPYRPGPDPSRGDPAAGNRLSGNLPLGSVGQVEQEDIGDILSGAGDAQFAALVGIADRVACGQSLGVHIDAALYHLQPVAARRIEGIREGFPGAQLRAHQARILADGQA